MAAVCSEVASPAAAAPAPAPAKALSPLETLVTRAVHGSGLPLKALVEAVVGLLSGVWTAQGHASPVPVEDDVSTLVLKVRASPACTCPVPCVTAASALRDWCFDYVPLLMCHDVPLLGVLPFWFVHAPPFAPCVGTHQVAERVPYGVKPRSCSAPTDTSRAALWR